MEFRLFTSLLLFFVFFNTHAQQHLWVKNFGSITIAKYEGGTSICTDDSGNIFTTGWFRDIADFDPGLGVKLKKSLGRNDNDVFIHKMDSSGRLIWVKTLTGLGDDVGTQIRIDRSGNVIIAGRFKDTTDFDPGIGTYNLVSNGRFDFFVLKLDPSGKFLWAHSIGGANDEEISNIMIDDSNNIYYSGTFTKAIDFDPSINSFVLGSSSSLYSQTFFSKFSATGQFLWAKQISDASCLTSTLDKNNNIIICGTFLWAASDFDPSSSTFSLNPNPNRFYIAKYSPTGNLIWAKNIGAHTSNISSEKMQTDHKNNIYLTAQFIGSIDVDPDTGTTTLVSKGGSEILVLKLSPNGSLIWSRGFGSVKNDDVVALNLDKNGFIHVLGNVGDVADLDPGLGVVNVGVSNIYTDPFSLKLSPNGDFIWAYSLPNLGPEMARDIAFGLKSEFYTTGNFRDSLDFNPDSAISDIRKDDRGQIFVHKLRGCNSSFDTISIISCNLYNSPSGNYMWTVSGNYNDTLINRIGCDSILTINLKINKVLSVAINTKACDSYRSPSGNFVWNLSGNYNDTLKSINGCDSVLNISLNIGRTSFFQKKDTVCNRYNSPSGLVWKSSGQYSDTILNYQGCDSVIQIELKIDSVNFGVSKHRDSLKSLAPSTSTFQWLDCNSKFNQITNEKSFYYTPKITGMYAVEVNYKNCIDTSDCLNISVITSLLNTINVSKSFIIYPNPTNSSFRVEMNGGILFTKIDLITITGDVVFTKHVNLSNTTIISFVGSAGTYFLKVYDGDKLLGVQRVIFN